MSKPARTTCPTCNAPLAWESFGGMRLLRTVGSVVVYRAECRAHGTFDVVVSK